MLDRLPARLQFSASTRSKLFDIALAAAVALLGVPWHGTSPLPFWVQIIVVFPALLVRRRRPLIAVGVSLAAMLLRTNPLPAMIALYTLASRRGPTKMTWICSAVGLMVAVGLSLPVSTQYLSILLLLMGMLVGFPLLFGLWMFQRRKLMDALRGRAEQAERERDLLAERAVAAERRRIAGEMHDVVAHRVGVIAIQANALTVVAPDAQTSQVAGIIQQNSTAALAELRDVLRVLREDGDPESSPPGLDGIPALAEDSRVAGRAVELSLPDPLPETAEPVGRAAYRVVQEALTNVAKHAPGATARVCVSATPEGLVVEVSNDRTTAQPAGLPSSGYGLMGMRERVSLAGGRVDTGPAGGGYRVRAVFPL